MFIDTATILVKAGEGGNGIVSFHHARGLPMGGPDGGDGGHGGNVIFIASNNENTLANFRFQKEVIAELLQPGYLLNGQPIRHAMVKVTRQ